MKNLIAFIAKALVDHPEQFLVREFGRNHTKIEAAKIDIGKVIGRHGRNSYAIRTIQAAASERIY